MMNLEGRTALITGGAGHLGLAMAEALDEVGASIAFRHASMRCLSKGTVHPAIPEVPTRAAP